MTKKPQTPKPYTVIFYVDGEDQVETFIERVTCEEAGDAWDLAVEQARDGGHVIRDDEFMNATEIVTLAGHHYDVHDVSGDLKPDYTGETYRINTLDDILRLPPGPRSRLIADLPRIAAASDALPNRKGFTLANHTFVDDGDDTITNSVNGEPVS